jgi:hypothetical protein
MNFFELRWFVYPPSENKGQHPAAFWDESTRTCRVLQFRVMPGTPWQDVPTHTLTVTDSASACLHDLQEPYTTIAVRGEDFNEAKCSVCGEEWRLPSTVTGAP